MTFFKIETLFLLWAVPILWLVYLYGMRKRRKILESFASTRGLQSLVPATGHRRRWLKAALVLLVFLLAVIALAGPKYGYRWQEIEQKGIDIIIALDCSKSMLATDIAPSRLDRAKREVYDLLTMLQGDRIGLVAFAGTAFLQCPLTIDYDAFHLFLNALTPSFLPVGGTDLSAAVATALESFDVKSTAEKAIILITDGENTGSGDPLQAAAEARHQDVKLFCIGVGKDDGVPLPQPEGGFQKDPAGKIVLSSLDEETLKKMAVATGGSYVRSVAGDMDLDAIYKEQIRGKMQAATVAGGRKQIFENRYQWPLALAVILFIIVLFLATVPSKGVAIVALLLLVGRPPAVQADPLQEGLDAYAKGDYKTALNRLIDAQLQNPDRPALLYDIGNAYYKIGDYDSAYHHFNQVLQSQDQRLKHKALYNLGNTCFRRGEFEEALQHYEAALKIDPNDTQARENIEFVKQVIQQQKARSTPQNDKGENQKQKRPPAQDKQATSSPSTAQNQDQEQPPEAGSTDRQEKPEPLQQYGQQMDEEMSTDPLESDKTSGDQQNGAQATAQTSKPKPVPESRQPVEKMLNRLKDQPGKAAIPFYRKRDVERDW